MSTARDIAAWLAATTTKLGPVELATQAEVDAGTDAERAVTPDTLEATTVPGGLIDVQVFSSNGTWTKPSGCQLAEVIVMGAGGGSAGAGTVAGEFRFGGGGGGGGYGHGLFLASGWGATVAVVVGTGGAGGAAGNNDGSTGGQSTFNGTSSPYVQASGGQGGTASLAINSFGGAGTGGTAAVVGEISNTDFAITGSNGSRHGAVGSTYQALSGGCPCGPFAPRGLIPAGKHDPGSYSIAGVGAGSFRQGTGGAGAAIRGGASTAAGAAGTDGLVIVRSYG